jgi:hypothetical protein
MTLSNNNKISVDAKSANAHNDDNNLITIDFDSVYDSDLVTTGSECDITLDDISSEFTLDMDNAVVVNAAIDLSSVHNINAQIIDEYEVERMCEHYPSLNTAWKNFKSIYDMTKQDWEGKKKSGDVDDGII